MLHRLRLQLYDLNYGPIQIILLYYIWWVTLSSASDYWANGLLTVTLTISPVS